MPAGKRAESHGFSRGESWHAGCTCTDMRSAVPGASRKPFRRPAGTGPKELTMKRVQQGFTLIELMIVVAIIGILAAVALPQYRDYTTRSRWAANVAAVDSLKTAITLCLQENAGNVASCDDATKLQTAGVIRTATLPTIPNGTLTLAANTLVMTITGTNGAAGCSLTLTPNGITNAVHNGNDLTWTIAPSGTGCDRANTGFAAPAAAPAASGP